MRGDQPTMIAGRCQEKLFTPHARGSIQVNDRFIESTSIYPADAGINLHKWLLGLKKIHLPRMRGDQPNGYATCNAKKEFTPQARGLTRLPDQSSQCSAIYPACAGITLCRSSAMVLLSNLPRMRGDQPASGTDRADMPAFTPRVRGSTHADPRRWFCSQIYPACAGINLLCPKRRKIANNLPPHARGSTQGDGDGGVLFCIYPACAGITLYQLSLYTLLANIPDSAGFLPRGYPR